MTVRLADRYELGEPLGTSQTAPVLATDTESGKKCVVKELTLGRVTDWKQLDLFEREASALKQLSHDGVPRFVDSLQSDDDGPRFYLVQSYIEGESLHQRLIRGLVPEEDLTEIAKGVLGILAYLQSFSPPVLHRDIKPANILLKPDGDIALVDFGTVQVELQGTMGGSTIVGTSGYMAPEQLMGRAVPGSDIYALGTCLVQAMTGQHPNDLPMERMKPKWRGLASGYSDRFVDLVDRMVEPNPSHRFEDADAVLRAFGGGRTTALSRPSELIRATRPSDTDIELKRSSKRLIVEFSNRGMSAQDKGALGVFLSMGLVAGIVFLQRSSGTPVPVIVFVVGLFLALLPLIWKAVKGRGTGYLELDVDRGYRVRSPDTDNKLRAGRFDGIIGPDRGYGAQSKSFYLATKDGMFEVGTSCSEAEQDWLIDEIGDFIQHQRGR